MPKLIDICNKARKLTLVLLSSLVLGLCVAILGTALVVSSLHESGLSRSGGLLSAVALGAMLLLLRFDVLPKLKSVRAVIIALLLIGLGLRVVPIVAIHNKQVSDFQIYHELAVALADGDGFAYTGAVGRSEDLPIYLNRAPNGPYRHTAFRPPGGPLLLAGAYMVAGQNPIVGKVLNALLGTLGGLCLYGMLLPTNRRLAFWAGCLWLIYPSSILATNLLGTEAPFTALMLLFGFLLTKAVLWEKKTAILLVLLAGCVAGFCSLVRPAMYLGACGLLAIVLCSKSLTKTLLGAIVFVIAFAIPLTAWGIRNYYTLGRFHMQSTNVGQELARRSPKTGTLEDQPLETLRILVTMDRSQDEFELDRIGRQLAMQKIFALKDQDLKTIARDVLLRHHLEVWQDDLDALDWCSRSSYFQTARDDQPKPIAERYVGTLEYVFQGSYLVVLVLAVVGAARFKRLDIHENAGLLAVLVFFLLSSLLFLVFLGKPRFHYPLMPFLCIMGANAINVWGERRQRIRVAKSYPVTPPNSSPEGLDTEQTREVESSESQDQGTSKDLQKRARAQAFKDILLVILIVSVSAGLVLYFGSEPVPDTDRSQQLSGPQTSRDEMWIREAQAMVAAGRRGEALGMISTALSVAPSSNLWMIRASILFELARYDEAMTAASEAMRLDPTNKEALVIKAYACARSRNIKELEALHLAYEAAAYARPPRHLP